MKQMMKDTLIIFLITVIAGLALGFVHELTADKIVEQQEKKAQRAYQEVFPEADSFKEVAFDKWDQEEIELNKLLKAYDQNDQEMGIVMVLTTPNGYGGDISFTMGVTNNGVLMGISIISISETAGLGMEAEDVLVPQFKRKAVDSFNIVKQPVQYDNQIQAISGATITTTAITEAVNAGLDYYYNTLGGAHYE